MDPHAVSSEQVPVAPSTLSINQDGDVASVLHPETGKIFVVNRVGRRIIELCDGSHTVSGIAATISNEFDHATAEKIAGDLERFLAQAASKGLVAIAAK